jgi:hypothetical protein
VFRLVGPRHGSSPRFFPGGQRTETTSGRGRPEPGGELIAEHRRAVLRQRAELARGRSGRTATPSRKARPRRGGANSGATEWLPFAPAHADQLQALPDLPPDPEITSEALKPYLRGWSPYGPNPQVTDEAFQWAVRSEGQAAPCNRSGCSRDRLSVVHQEPQRPPPARMRAQQLPGCISRPRALGPGGEDSRPACRPGERAPAAPLSLDCSTPPGRRAGAPARMADGGLARGC